MMDKLGVVIVTYNRLDLLKVCIEHALNQTVQFKKIIIVDNNSNDGTGEYLKSVKKNNVFVLSLNENIGGAGGFYEGMKSAQDFDLDWVLLIDDDAIINYDFNEKIIKCNTDKDILAYSGVVTTNSSIDLNHRRNLVESNEFNEQIIDEKLYSKKYFDCDLATFCGLYIKMDLIKKIGLPNKDFFIWYDDTEYSLRINKYTKIRNVNNAIIDHRCTTSKNGKIVFSWKEYYGRRNKLFIIKHYFSKKSLRKYEFWLRLAAIKHTIKYVIFKDKESKYKANICKDALRDGKNEMLGKNKNYLPNNK